MRLVQRALLTVVLLASASAIAQAFPNGQLRIISPYPPGGGTDVLGRVIAQRYTERFGHPAIVENRAGANGTIGTAFVAKAPPDGLTLLIVPAGYAAMNVTQSIPLVAANKLRALGVTSPQRSATAPQIPTIAEEGLKGFDMTNCYGMLVPAATPRETINTINTEINTIIMLHDTRKSLSAQGMVIQASSADQFAEFLKRESAKYGRVIQAAGIRGAL